MNQHPDVFKAKTVDHKLFLKYLFCVQSRAFGLDGLSLVPMLDCINHSSVNVSYGMVNSEMLKDPIGYQDHYR